MKEQELKISKEISLPKSAVTETFAMIGRRGAGKSYLATMVAEQMLDIHAQVVVIDPVGIWWGLRVAADGKSKGKEIFVVGGEHGDVPIIPEAGRKIAQLVVDKSISVVIDVSGFRMGEHKRFAADFAEEFFHLKKSKKTPVHVFIEEAQTLIPQRVGADEARMVGAFERIVRLGRNYGIGCSLITQRPQSVNKEVLSQVECLFVLQITGLHERKAIEGWVQEHGVDRKLIGELPSLERGEGYVWSPAFLKIYKRVHFAKKTTFDASATPIVGKEARAASIQAVDVERLKNDMADVVEKAEKDNPVALRKKIAELERGIKTPVIGADIDKLIKNALNENDRKFAIERRDYQSQIDASNKKIAQIAKIIGSDIAFPMQIFSAATISKEIIMEPGRILKVNSEEKPLRAGAMKMLNWLAGSPDRQLTKQRVATLSGFSMSGGTFNTYISELKKMGWIIGGDILEITEQGMQNAIPQEIPSGEDLVALWKSKFRAGAGNILQYVYDNNSVSKDDIGNALNFEISGGTFNTYISELRRNGLILVDGNIIIIAPEFN